MLTAYAFHLRTLCLLTMFCVCARCVVLGQDGSVEHEGRDRYNISLSSAQLELISQVGSARSVVLHRCTLYMRDGMCVKV